MNRFRKFLTLAVAAVAATILGAPTRAEAGYGLEVFDDGVLQAGITVIPLGDSLIFAGSTTHFSLTNGSGSSNNPGTPGGSNLDLSNNEQITTDFGTAGGTHTIQIVLSQDGWTAPPSSPLNLSSSAGGSIGVNGATILGNTVTATYQGFLDNTNTLFGMPGSGSTPVQSATTSLTQATNPLVFSPGVSIANVPGGTPFSMTDVLTFTFTLAPGTGQDTANVSASTTASAVPAPAGLMLALTGAPVLGIGGWLRRRRAQAA